MTQYGSIVTPPAIEPVTLADVKLWLQLDTDITQYDTMLSDLITACRQDAEEYTGRAFITQTRCMWLDAPPYFTDDMVMAMEESMQINVIPLLGQSVIDIPWPQLQSISSVVWYDIDDNPTTWDPANYRVDAISTPGRIVLNSGVQWPSPLRGRQALFITYVCGYGDAATAVPSSIKTAIKMMCGWRFEHRTSDDMPEGALKMLDKYRMFRIG